jgi:hypothetical protein
MRFGCGVPARMSVRLDRVDRAVRMRWTFAICLHSSFHSPAGREQIIHYATPEAHIPLGSAAVPTRANVIGAAWEWVWSHPRQPFEQRGIVDFGVVAAVYRDVWHDPYGVEMRPCQRLLQDS